MIKAVLLSLTMLLALYPYTTANFNTSSDTSAIHFHKGKVCFAHHSSTHKGRQDKSFGAEMGEWVRSQIQENNYKIKTVVIDPGHGGHDSGCSGKNKKEKNIALRIGLKLGKTLESQYPNLNIIYTRNRDVFVPLHKRAAIANNNEADLFISIHCNAIPNAPKVRGSETYVMGLHTANENLEVAKRENSAILLEEDYQQNYYGYDPNSPEGHIMLSMYQNAFLEQSILFANKVERQINQHAQRKSRGVKQAGFLVLRKTTMPSVLVEAGYMTNASDDAFLSTNHGQNKIAQAIFKAFNAYKYEVEGGVEQNRMAANPTVPRRVPVSQSMKERDKKAPKRIIAHSSKINKSTQPKVELEQLTAKQIPSSYIIPDQPLVKDNYQAVQYKVQIAVSKNLLDTQESKWHNMSHSIEIKQEKEFYKYLVIGFENFNEALNEKTKLRQKGFPEAFVVAYHNGKRISIADARNMR